MTTQTETSSRPRQFTLEERVKHFPLDYTINHALGIERTPAIVVRESWERQNLVRIGPYENFATGYRFSPRVHILAAPVFHELFKAVDHSCRLEAILTFDGGFYPRLKRGVDVPPAGSPKSAYEALLSNHSRGTAIDLNAAMNPRTAPYDAAKWKGVGDLSRIIAIADTIRVKQEDGTEWGVVAGAHWKGETIDPQHFELGVWP